MIDLLLDLILLTFLVVIAVAIVRRRNLFAVIMLFGIFSLLSAGLFVVLDAADVAFTEAAVGAGVSTVLMLATLALTGGRNTELPPFHRPGLPLLVVLATGAALLYGTWDIAGFGDPQAPVHGHVAPDYLTRGPVETGMPNVVTSILASYRSFDTLGEVTVIFTAGIAVLLLIGSRPENGDDEEDGR